MDPDLRKCSSCIVCDHIETGSSFTSTSTKNNYKINQFINCRTTKVIYLATCSCGLQYEGKTTREFRRRIGEYLGDRRPHRDTAISRYIWQQYEGNNVHICFKGIDLNEEGRQSGEVHPPERSLLGFYFEDFCTPWTQQATPLWMFHLILSYPYAGLMLLFQFSCDLIPPPPPLDFSILYSLSFIVSVRPCCHCIYQAPLPFLKYAQYDTLCQLNHFC